MIPNRYDRSRSRTSRRRASASRARCCERRWCNSMGRPDIWLKLENLQPTNAYKIRGARQRGRQPVRRPSARRGRVDDQRRQCRAGRRLCGTAVRHPLHCGRDRDRTADQARPNARARRDDRPGFLRPRLGCRRDARISPASTARSSTRSTITISSPGTARWASRSSRTCPDVRTVICAIGGGGLITGVGSADQGAQDRRRRSSAPSPKRPRPTPCRCAKAGRANITDWQASFVDGAGGKSVTERMWQRMRPVTDGAITVTLEQTRNAMRLIAEKSRTIAEGAGALALAAALSGEAVEGPIVCVVSGGNIDLGKFAELVAN